MKSGLTCKQHHDVAACLLAFRYMWTCQLRAKFLKTSKVIRSARALDKAIDRLRSDLDDIFLEAGFKTDIGTHSPYYPSEENMPEIKWLYNKEENGRDNVEPPAR